MKLLVPAVLFVLCSAAFSVDPSASTSEPRTTTEAITTERHTSTTPTPTTAPPTTTTTTTEPTTTSEATTKEAPVTTTTDATTPTGSPHTITPPATTTSPATTTEAPKPCNFNVTSGNVTCIRAEILAKFLVPIEGKNVPIQLDCDSQLGQIDCSSNETQKLVLVSPNVYVLTMIFEKEKETVSLTNISFAYTLSGGRSEEVANNSGNLIKMKAGNSYLCRSEIDIPLENVTMQINEIRIQAFGGHEDNFGTAEECEADDKVSDIVPIAVGVALGALIIIVLIAYLVGRRRSRQKGYQSV